MKCYSLGLNDLYSTQPAEIKSAYQLSSSEATVALILVLGYSERPAFIFPNLKSWNKLGRDKAT